MQVIHTVDSHFDVEHEGVNLCRYVYASKTPAIESPRPYFHPIRTLKGNIVSGFRPHDHRWHHGLSMTCANLGPHNFWGGPTYVRDEGYCQLDNNGEQRDGGMQGAGVDSFSHSVYWGAANGNKSSRAAVLSEQRELSFGLSDGFWSLTLEFELLWQGEPNGEPLNWGSPTTQGREMAGYGGLFWRGPRDFLGGNILMSEGRAGAELMGKKSPWLAYIGCHDETDDTSTLVFIDHPSNPRYPTKWFVRDTTPMVCPNFAFDEEYSQKADETLFLKYQILIADGAWERERIEAEVANLKWQP